MPDCRRFRCAVLILGLFLAGTGFSAARSPDGEQAASPSKPPAAPPDLDATVARVMKAFDVPGVSLAIVKDASTT